MVSTNRARRSEKLRGDPVRLPCYGRFPTPLCYSAFVSDEFAIFPTQPLKNSIGFIQAIAMDAKVLAAKKKKSTFESDIQFVRNVICGPSLLDHQQSPQMGCVCYYCDKHWSKTGGPPCFNTPQ